MVTTLGFLSAILAFASVVVVLALAFGIRLFLNPERSARDRIVDLTGGKQQEEASIFQAEAGKSAAKNSDCKRGSPPVTLTAP